MRALTLLFFAGMTMFVGEMTNDIFLAAHPYAEAPQLLNQIAVIGMLVFLFCAFGAAIDDFVKRIRRHDAKERRKEARMRSAMTYIPPSYRPVEPTAQAFPTELNAAPARAVNPTDGSWICSRCQSINSVVANRCYSCSTWRLPEPAM